MNLNLNNESTLEAFSVAVKNSTSTINGQHGLSVYEIAEITGKTLDDVRRDVIEMTDEIGWPGFIFSVLSKQLAYTLLIGYALKLSYGTAHLIARRLSQLEGEAGE